MTTGARKVGDVNRLVDMVVEEVSLVDRAANNRQFLIVKRDESMTEDTDSNKAADDSSAVDDTTDDQAEDATGGTPIDIAIAALESLTSIVEALGELRTNGDAPRLAELAQQLRDAADQLVADVDGEEEQADMTETSESSEGVDAAAEAQSKAKAGAKGKTPAKGKSKPAPKTEGKSPKTNKPDKTDEADSEGDATTDQLKAAQSALAKLALMLGGAVRNEQAQRPAPANVEPTNLATTVSKLTEAVQQLTQSFNDQQQRLGRVEKQFGLPNSAASAERSSKVSDDAVGWPLDLNHPMDRQSIDKSVSFHDP